MSFLQKQKRKWDRKLFLLLFFISLTLFIFTNDGHRYTFDEDVAQQQSKRIVTMEPHPEFELGKSRPGFEFPWVRSDYFPLCREAILCSSIFIGHTITQVPFVFINYNFGIITESTLILTNQDFNDPYYVFWRNSIDPDFIFLELFYGPIFSSLSVATFYLICRLFKYKQKTSIGLSFIFATATSVWAYSQTSFNLIPSSFFVLLGIYFVIKYMKKNSIISLIYSSICLGFSFLVRQDASIIIVLTSILVAYFMLRRSKKLKSLISFFGTLGLTYVIYKIIDNYRVISDKLEGGISYIPIHTFPLHIGATGLLFSPGVGIFVFYPVLATCFVSFVDFYKKNKIESIFFLAIVCSFIVFYGTGDSWHGMNAWAARYLLSVIPFFLIPLGASLEKRGKFFFAAILILAGLGVLSNTVYVIQDENWFVWGIWGSEKGLTSLGAGLNIHPAAMWTFEYSQLTHSILTAFTNLQLDIYLLKLFGTSVYLVLLLGVLIPLGYLIIRILQTDSRYEYLKQKY